jgi:hypothetical protein
MPLRKELSITIFSSPYYTDVVTHGKKLSGYVSSSGLLSCKPCTRAVDVGWLFVLIVYANTNNIFTVLQVLIVFRISGARLFISIKVKKPADHISREKHLDNQRPFNVLPP